MSTTIPITSESWNIGIYIAKEMKAITPPIITKNTGSSSEDILSVAIST
jgi:hypothetical protein